MLHSLITKLAVCAGHYRRRGAEGGKLRLDVYLVRTQAALSNS